MGAVEHPSYIGEMPMPGIGHTDAHGISHTDVMGDIPIGPVRLFGVMEMPGRV